MHTLRPESALRFQLVFVKKQKYAFQLPEKKITLKMKR